MSEIVVSEPIHGDDDRENSIQQYESETGNQHQRPSFTSSFTYRERRVPEPFDSEKLPVTLGYEIRKFLRVANQLQREEPRVACLCRFHAFEKAHIMDKNSTGRGVRQFKTALLQRLQRDMAMDMEDNTTKRSFVRELRRVYNGYYNYIIRHTGADNFANREKLMNARVIASVLFEVLLAVTSVAGHQALTDRDAIDRESQLYVPYNILPLDPGGAHQAIMQFPEIKAAVAAVRHIRGLPFMDEFKRKRGTLDIFDWLQFCFGFQDGNVANQREHLILLLANTHIRECHNQGLVLQLSERAVDALMKKFFKNYTNWCKFLDRKSDIRLPYVKQEARQYKLLYISLYLLIWGEAANLRFMPECLCYIYHHMAYELHSMLTGAVSATTWEKVLPAYGGRPEAFLNFVVSPIYNLIKGEAEKSKNGTADHSTWRNYDDLNEFFWSPECFTLDWPMKSDHDFFYVDSKDDENDKKDENHKRRKLKKREQEENKDEELGEASETTDEKNEKVEQEWIGKTNFVEIRSFLQIFRSFDRLWSFLILAFQALIVIAYHDLDSPFQLLETEILEDIMSVFITSAALKFTQASLEILFFWKVRRTMEPYQFLKYTLKVIVAMVWTILLPVLYACTRRNYTCLSTYSRTWFGEWCYSSYMLSVVIYQLSNAIEMVLFFVPAVGRYIETSDSKLFSLLSWWNLPRLYVGRGMQEDQVSIFKYTLFWILLLLSKLSFSYYFEIKPLIEPTKQILRLGVKRYEWHELIPAVESNVGAVIAIWTPITLVYFMDTQIWYSVSCTVFGGVYGILHHLGEIRTLAMLRSKFHSLPTVFNAHLIPPVKKDKGEVNDSFPCRFFKGAGSEKKSAVKFIIVWNQIISSFREEDLISNREMDLMLMPLPSEIFSGQVRWPVFLLANKLSTAVSIAEKFVGKDRDLSKKIKRDVNMNFAVKECYDSLKYILDIVVVGELEKRIVSSLITEIEESIQASTLLKDIRMTKLPCLKEKCIELAELLVEGNEYHHAKVVKALQDIFELVTNEMIIKDSRTMNALHSSLQSDENSAYYCRRIYPELFASESSIHFPLANSGPLYNQVKRFLLLLTVKDSAVDIPVNLDAQRRISFLATSLFMDMPIAPKVRNMLSFSVLTPHYTEEVKFTKEELLQSSKDRVSIAFYMQKIFPDEWKNFLERMGCENLEALERKVEELRDWTSFRGQTLSRTVRGMMYYRKALKLQAFLDMAENADILQGYDVFQRENDALAAQLDALADMKFTHVVSCQMYGEQKISGDRNAQDILDLMNRYPCLRLAYVEEWEEMVENKPEKFYSSVLVKAVNKYDQEIYRIKLPGPPNIGEGKPENQNHAIIFTRGEALQTIDMNQDNYLEEALKMRNLLQEFVRPRGLRPPTIVGLREHIFTGSVSSLECFMSYQETSFVTIGQRLLATPLRVRFHYGHPDLFDRVFHITRGGVSKASRTINLSEDVFAGYNSVLRRGYVTYHEYMQVGKGRDVGLNQISIFEAKIANGNSEQALSRDLYRLGRRFDFFRMLSCYYTTIGIYVSSLISVVAIYIFLYGQLYLVLSGLQKALLIEARIHNIKSLETALASQSFIQLGLLTGLPMVMELALERGFLNALKDFLLMQLQLASVFFTFSFGTKSHYFGRTILHGGAKYRPTGRRVVIFHATFTENYRLYSRSHFIKGFELLLLLTVYDIFRRSYQSSVAYVLITYAIWFLSLSWLFTPFLFNPSGFDWERIVDDWTDWNKWMRHQGGIGIQQDKSWESWWYEEQAHLKRANVSSRIFEVILSVRFFLYQYGLVYHLDISAQSKNFVVYVLSWVVILVVLLLAKLVSMGRKRLSQRHQFAYRMFKAFLFLAVLSTIVTLSAICHLTVTDLVVCCLGFIPTGWGLVLVGQAVRPILEKTRVWKFMLVLARAYDYGMGVVLFFPIAVLAWLPIIQAFQTRFLFNEAFNRRLQIQPILPAKIR